MDYERPPSDQMVDIHVYLVPLGFWREQLNSAVNQIIDDTISMGFVRVYPDSYLQELRRDIATQLGDVGLPTDYTFLRSVGRCLTRVQAKQEVQLKAKNYIPPQAYAPEIFILEGPPDNRSSVGHPFSRWSGGDRSVQNSSDTVRTTRSDGPYKPLPAINHSRNASPATRSDVNPNTSSDAEHSDDSRNSRTGRKSSDDDRPYNEDEPTKDNSQWDEERWEQRPNSNDGQRRDEPDNDNQYDANRERTLPPLSASPTLIRMKENDEDDEDKRENQPTPPPGGEYDRNHPLSATPPHSRNSSPKQRERGSRSTNKRREFSDGEKKETSKQRTHRRGSRSPDNESLYRDDDKENNDSRKDAWQESYDTKEDRYDDSDRYEDHNHQENGHLHPAAGHDKSDSNKRQFSSIQEENEEYQSQHHRDKEEHRHGNRSPSGNAPRTNRRKSKSPKSRSPENNRRQSIKDKGQLLRELDEARRERQEIERRREELVKRAKHLQAQTQQKRNQARDIWKKKYFEEKKKTPPLEEQVTRLRTELENLHHRIINQLEGSKEEGIGAAPEKSSNFNNIKLQATKAAHEITDLQRRVENVNMKLTGEIKLRKQAEVELKALKAELTQKKINLTLTRSQQLNSNSSSLSNSYNGFSSAR